MKNLISILIIVLFFSCTAKKNMLHTKTDQQTTLQNSIADAKTSHIDAVKVVVDHSADSVETVIKKTTYDTSKPVDQSTGKPPVLEESITTQTKVRQKTIKTGIGISDKQESSRVDESKSVINSKQEIKSTEKSKPWDGKYIFYALALIALFVTAFIIYKKFATIKKFLG